MFSGRPFFAQLCVRMRDVTKIVISYVVLTSKKQMVRLRGGGESDRERQREEAENAVVLNRRGLGAV